MTWFHRSNPQGLVVHPEVEHPVTSDQLVQIATNEEVARYLVGSANSLDLQAISERIPRGDRVRLILLAATVAASTHPWFTG